MKRLFYPLQGSLLAALLAASQLAWSQTAVWAQDAPGEVRFPVREVQPSSPEDEPPLAGDRIAPGTRPLVVDVILRGTKYEEKALNNIRTKKEYEFDPATLQADVRRLLTSGQYRNVRPYVRNVAEGVVVIFEFSERPRIKTIEFLGNRGFSDKKMLKTVNMKAGDPLNTYEVEEGRRKLEELYHTKGYPNAVIGIVEGDKPEDQAVIYSISEGYLLRISSLSFEGNTFASDGQLKAKVASKPGYLWLFINGKFDRAKLDADVEKLTAYYRDFGYFRARLGRQLDFDESGKWVGIKFIIDEGPRYNVRNVSITGNNAMRTQPLLDALQLKNGKPYNTLEKDKDQQLLNDLYGSTGRIFVSVNPELRFREEPGEVDLVYKIQEGEPFRVGQINVHIAGEFPHTRRNVVLNRMSLRPGDLIDIREVRDSERRLKLSQLFGNEQTGDEPPKIVVRPPELKDATIAGVGNGSLRGQSPDFTLPTYDLDVYVPRLRDEPPPRTINGIRRLPPTEQEAR
jgi:outer membrane protein insertion porin family